MLRVLLFLVVVGLLALAGLVATTSAQLPEGANHKHPEYITQLDDLRASRNLMIVNIVALLLAAVAYGAMIQVLRGFSSRFADHSNVIKEHTTILAQVISDVRSITEVVERIQSEKTESTIERKLDTLQEMMGEIRRERKT